MRERAVFASAIAVRNDLELWLLISYLVEFAQELIAILIKTDNSNLLTLWSVCFYDCIVEFSVEIAAHPVVSGLDCDRVGVA